MLKNFTKKDLENIFTELDGFNELVHQATIDNLKLKINNLKLDMSIIKNIFAIGMAPFFMQIAASLVTIISNNALKTHGGDMAIGAMTVINAIAIFFLMPIFGINQGSQPIIGFNYGAGEYKRVKSALKLAVAAGTAVATLGFILTQFYTVGLIKIFNDDPELIKFTTTGMKIFFRCIGNTVLGLMLVMALTALITPRST